MRAGIQLALWTDESMDYTVKVQHRWNFLVTDITWNGYWHYLKYVSNYLIEKVTHMTFYFSEMSFLTSDKYISFYKRFKWLALLIIFVTYDYIQVTECNKIWIKYCFSFLSHSLSIDEFMFKFSSADILLNTTLSKSTSRGFLHLSKIFQVSFTKNFSNSLLSNLEIVNVSQMQHYQRYKWAPKGQNKEKNLTATPNLLTRLFKLWKSEKSQKLMLVSKFKMLPQRIIISSTVSMCTAILWA